MVRSKTGTAQRNEVLCKFVCQNVTCLISAVYELGLSILPGEQSDEPAVLKFPGVVA